MADSGNRKSVTIEDVASAAGVSRQTVSRVINHSPNVRPAVRERIDAAIAELGYTPNLAARRMGGARSFLILAINDRQRTIDNWRAGRGNDWVDQMLFGGMMTCEAHGYHMLFELVDTDTAQALRQLDRILSALSPDGVILTQPHSNNPALIDLLKARGTRVARIGPPDALGGISVSMDERGAAEHCTGTLIGLGHRRIAFLAGSPAYGASGQRVAGYHDALTAAGIACDETLIVAADYRFDRAADATHDLLRRSDRPSAIIAENDEMAFAVLHSAGRMGIAVPADLSLICFEDTPGVRFSVPPLTAIRQPTAAIIATACEKLIVTRGSDGGAASYQLPYELVTRETSGPFTA